MLPALETRAPELSPNVNQSIRNMNERRKRGSAIQKMEVNKEIMKWSVGPHLAATQRRLAQDSSAAKCMSSLHANLQRMEQALRSALDRQERGL
jgi:hypothetical protein